jgi:hypothetical protein
MTTTKFETMRDFNLYGRVECSNSLNVPEPAKPVTKRFYFNTGVRPETVFNPPFPYEYHKKIGNVIRGTLLIPFDCNDVPENATFKCAASNPNLYDNIPNIIVRKIVGGNLLSEYAYFILP